MHGCWKPIALPIYILCFRPEGKTPLAGIIFCPLRIRFPSTTIRTKQEFWSETKPKGMMLYAWVSVGRKAFADESH